MILEVWLRERECRDKLVRQQVLKVCKHKEKDLHINIKDNYKHAFNITYHRNVSNLKDAMSFLHLLLTREQEHQ